MYRQRVQEGRRVSRGWPILVAIILLISSLGCSLATRIVGPRVLAAGPQDGVAAALLQVATRTPWPTFTPTVYYSPTPWFTPLATPTPTDTATPTSTATPTNTPIPTATAALFVPTATPVPTNTRAPLPPTAVPTPTPTPTPSFAYRMFEVYEDYTSNLFLTGYIAIVNAQEIPIGGVKAVGVFEPGGQRHESPLSQWFFDARTAPSVVVKTASVKFEPPGGIQRGTWFIHLEDEWGTRLSEDVPINTDPASPKWFYIKFKQPSPVAAKTPATAAAANSRSYSTSPTAIRPTAIRPTAGPTPAWYPTPTPTATRPASTAGWAFSSVQSVTGQDGLTVYGDLLNQTGSSQQLAQVVGTFYDGQGQVIAGPDDGYDFWPTQVVPPGGRMPFDLAVYDIQSAADFDLEVISQPTGETPRQDFEFLEVATSSTNGSYCVTGNLRNPGGELSLYLVISAALYNSEDKVINFDILDVPTPGLVVGDKALSFSICVDTHNQQAARYELQAWGQ